MYDSMRCMKQSIAFFLIFAASLAPSTDCRAATDEINVPSTFTHVLLTKETVAPEVAKCLPSMNAEFLSSVTEKFPQDGAFTTIQNNDGYFIIADTNGYCVQKSADGYAVLATEAFYNTANPPKEVPSNVTEKLYKEIATLIAKKGSAKVAYVFINGNAMLVDYSVKDATLLYPHTFKKAGEWESDDIDLRFSHDNMLSFDATEYNKKTEKHYLLIHRQ